jgi:putative ABC transport system permease protein
MREVVQAVRGLRLRPLFFAAAVATLGLGIGATTAVYSMVDAVLLAPLPYDEPDELVEIRTIDGEGEKELFPRAALESLEETGPSYAGLAAWGGGSWILSGAGEPEEVDIVRAEHDLFDLLGVRPVLGRLFTDEHRADGGNGRVVLLSWKLWQRRFGGDPDVVGRVIELREQPHEILGVMPPGFEFPVGRDVEAWVPLQYAAIDNGLRFTPVQHAVGRLAPGARAEEATAEATLVLRRVTADGTDMFGEPILAGGPSWTARAVPFREVMLVSDRALVLMLGAVALLLVIACANVANLFLVRASERRDELAVRAALGGGRHDLAGPVVIEVAVVTVLAAAGGLLLARWAVGALVALDPGGLPRWDGIALNTRAWLVASAATALAAVLCALAPALAAARSRAGDVVRAGARTTDSRARLRLRDVVVGIEITLVFVLLVSAGLLLRSFNAVRSIDPGYAINDVVTAGVVLPVARYPRAENASTRFYEELLTRLRAHPAVMNAAAVSTVPMSDVGVELNPELRSPVTGRVAASARMLFISPGFFRTLGIPLRGRDFDSGDGQGSQRVAILSESAARHMFPGEDVVGRRFSSGPGEWEVVGVVPDIRYDGPERRAPQTWYVPHTMFAWVPGMMFAVRTHGDAASFGPVLAGMIRELDPALPVADVRTLDQNLARALARRRFDLIMLGGIALAALGLAAVGVFGVMAHAVAQRRHELGIRQALGARAGDIVALVLGRSLAVTAAGAAAGAVLAVLAARTLRAVLFGVEPVDPVTFVLAACTVVAVGLLAAIAPAWRATRVDPAHTLRT